MLVSRSISMPAPARWCRRWLGTGAAWLGCALSTWAAATNPAPTTAKAPPAGQYIREYRVLGARELPNIEVADAVYPFLGPGRTDADVEAARAALEKAYHDKGFQAATVEIPVQTVRRGLVYLRVSEGRVGRLRVRGARYFLPSQIKAMMPSLAEGRAINFNNVTREILALNQGADRQVTPSLLAGTTPGTVDIDLNVKDTFPLHGSLELNNRYSINTTPLRLSGAISYTNLWQLGHAAGFNFEIAPQRLDDSEIYSAFYQLDVPGASWLSLLVQGTKQYSEIASLGSTNSISPGETLGIRALIELPPGPDFFQTLSLGFDYKNRFQNDPFEINPSTEITYFPLSIDYSANWIQPTQQTEFNANVTFSLRGTGSSSVENSSTVFGDQRFGSDDGFAYFRGELGHTHDLPLGFQVFARVKGQLASGPLVPSEQYAGGGLDTVRGYLEAAQLGDNAVFGTLELRSPSLLDWMKPKDAEWRIYAFVEGGRLALNDPLPEQTSRFDLASVGIGSRVRVFDHFNGSIDVGFPLIDTPVFRIPNVGEGARNPQVTFRVWSEF